MAVPTDPTLTFLIQEALKKAGRIEDFARARDFWMEEIKNEIWLKVQRDGNTRLKTLQTSAVQISQLGQSRYSFPSDFDEEMSIEILDGSTADTAQAGAALTVTLAAAEDITEDLIKGQYVLITSGTGVNGLRQVTAYSAATKVATVDSAWDTNPDNTSVYLVVDAFYKLEEGHIDDLTENQTRTNRQRPSVFHKVHEGVNVRFIFDYPPDKSTYGIQIRYYANLSEVDLTESGTLISAIYQNWRSVFDKGIVMKAAGPAHQNYGVLKGEFSSAVKDLIRKEIPYGGEFKGFTV